MTETMTLVSEGERTVVGIELPKDKPNSPTRNVKLNPDPGQQYGPSGWVFGTILGSITIGDLVSYRIEKNANGYKTFTHIAPAEVRDQTPTSSVSTKQASGRDDAQGGSPVPRDTDSRTPPERDVPNTDTARFEGYGFVGNVGMVELAFSELLDAYNGGDLDEITPAVFDTVARGLLNAADQGQRALVGRTDRGAQSHVRARGVVRAALLMHPVRAGLGDLDAWAAAVQKTAEKLLRVAASL